MLKPIPWSKDFHIPEMNDNNILYLFEEFRNISNCPSSVNISREGINNRIKMNKNGYTEHIAEDIEQSQFLDSDIYNETQDLVNLANTLMEQTNMFESLEQVGFDIGKNYDQSKRFIKVSKSSFT